MELLGGTYYAFQLAKGDWGRVCGWEGGMQLLGNGCSQARPCRKQSCMPALQQWKGTLAASCLTPGLRVLQLCCCMLMRNEEADVGKKKLQKALETTHYFSPLHAAVFQFGKLKGNARDQCQRGHSSQFLCVKSGKYLWFSL